MDIVLATLGLIAMIGVLAFFAWDRHRMCTAEIEGILRRYHATNIEMRLDWMDSDRDTFTYDVQYRDRAGAFHRNECTVTPRGGYPEAVNWSDPIGGSLGNPVPGLPPPRRIATGDSAGLVRNLPEEYPTKTMNGFQLVLQFAPWDSAHFDDLIALEQQLIVAVGSRATVDGHDAGSGQANIFLLTDHPTEVLRDCAAVVQRSPFVVFAAGCRSLDADAYRRVWPEGDHSPFMVKSQT